MYGPPTLGLVMGQFPKKQGLVSGIWTTSRYLGISIGIALFEGVFSAASQGEASIHQASSQTITLGFNQAVLLGVAASLIASMISLMIPALKPIQPISSEDEVKKAKIQIEL